MRCCGPSRAAWRRGYRRQTGSVCPSWRPCSRWTPRCGPPPPRRCSTPGSPRTPREAHRRGLPSLGPTAMGRARPRHCLLCRAAGDARPPDQSSNGVPLSVSRVKAASHLTFRKSSSRTFCTACNVARLLMPSDSFPACCPCGWIMCFDVLCTSARPYQISVRNACMCGHSSLFVRFLFSEKDQAFGGMR